MAPPSKALTEFVSEAQEILEALSKDLLRLSALEGSEPDPELINRVFRAAHSLKGLAGMFGLGPVSGLAHSAEDLLDDLRLGRVALSDPLVDLLLEVVETSQRMIGGIARGEGEPAETPAGAALSARIEAARRGEPAGSAAGPLADPLDVAGIDPSVRGVLTEYEEHRLRESLKKGAALYRVRAQFEITDFDKGLAELNARLKPAGEVISTLPSADPGSGGGIAFDILFGTTAERAAIDQRVQGLPAQVFSMVARKEDPLSASPSTQPALRPAPPEPKGAEQPRSPAREARSPLEPESSLRSVSQTVRVDIRRLDRLMNVVGELVLAKTNLQRLSELVKGSGSLVPAGLPAELQRETRVLERKLDELQKGILEVRMVPLEQVFDKLARMVRKIAREAGKEIDFRITGGEVELDKLIIEDLSDPLMHIIRNAIDHGVEPPQARLAAGKPRRGTVSLAAHQKGNHVVIAVCDDGRGIDEEAVKAAAILKGLTTGPAARDLARRDVLSFIFLPGFSTAKTVSELSGRGVGMDVVKTNVARLSGIIDVQSAPGQGTTLSLTLPVTLAIVRALVVGAAGRTYAVPLNSVLEVLQVPRRDVRTIETREVIDVRGATLPVVRLGRLFRHDGERASEMLFVVVVGLAQERLGLAVEELVGQQDVVVKSLGKVLSAVRGIAGATDLGNRRTVLVLDVGSIIEEVLAFDRVRREASA